MPAGLRKVYQYDFDGNFISEYENISAASYFNNDLNNNIYWCLSGRYKHAIGYYWTFKYYTKLPIEIIDDIKNSKYIKNELYKISNIYKYDLKGNLVDEFENLKSVSNDEIYCTNVLRVLDGNYKISDNHIWSIVYYEKLPLEILKIHLRKNLCEIYQYDTHGNFIQMWPNIRAASKSLNATPGTLSNALNGVRNKIYKNHIYRREYYNKIPKKIMEQHIDSRHKKILQYDLDGNFICEWNCTSDIQKKLKIGSNLSSVLTGKRKHSKGFIWRYKDN